MRAVVARKSDRWERQADLVQRHNRPKLTEVNVVGAEAGVEARGELVAFEELLSLPQ